MFSQIQSPFEEIDGMSMGSNYYYPPYEKPSNKWGWVLVILTTLAIVLGFVVWDRRKLLKAQVKEDCVMLEEAN